MRICRAIWRELPFILGVVAIGFVLYTALGCSAGSSSEITPATSSADSKSLRITAPRKDYMEIVVTIPPAAPTTVEVGPGEDK